VFWNSNAAWPVVKWAGVSYTTLAPYQTISSQDARSLQANPMFANVSGGDFHPTAGSPLIDSGNSGVPNWPSTDALGSARVDDPSTPNTGLGPIAYADRGALEYQPPSVQPARLSGAAPAAALTLGLAPRITPNPLRTSAAIMFQLDRPATVEVRIFDVGGRVVRTFPPIESSPGLNSIFLDGRGDRSGSLPAGMYLVEIRAGGQRAVGRFVVMR
jgi:hypothetical protein